MDLILKLFNWMGGEVCNGIKWIGVLCDKEGGCVWEFVLEGMNFIGLIIMLFNLN